MPFQTSMLAVKALTKTLSVLQICVCWHGSDRMSVKQHGFSTVLSSFTFLL